MLYAKKYIYCEKMHVFIKTTKYAKICNFYLMYLNSLQLETNFCLTWQLIGLFNKNMQIQ